MPSQGYSGLYDPSQLPYTYSAGLTGAADIIVLTNNTFNDLATLGSLPPGQYLCGGFITVVQATNACNLTLKIWDGTTSYAGVEMALLATDTKVLGIAGFILNLLSAKTIKMSAAGSNVTTTTAKYTAPDNGTGLTGLSSQLWAIRFA